MKSKEFEAVNAGIQQYAKWAMTGVYNGIIVSALSCTEEHRDKTLATWKKLKVQSIAVEEREVPEMPVFTIEVPTSRYTINFTMQASSKVAVERELQRRRYKPWQVMQATIKVAS